MPWSDPVESFPQRHTQITVGGREVSERPHRGELDVVTDRPGESVPGPLMAVGADPSRWKDEAPPTLVCETNQLTGNAEPDADAYLGHAWDLPLPVPCHMIRGGNDYRFGRPVRPDDVITTTWELVDAVERIGTGGRPLLLVTARATYTADDGEWLATNTETLIYRPSESK